MPRKKNDKPDARTVSVALTDQEWRDRSQVLGFEQGELEKVELERKRTNAGYAKDIKERKLRISELAKAVASRHEDRVVDDQAGLFQEHGEVHLAATPETIAEVEAELDRRRGAT